jgi:O-antigen ligase
MLETALPKIMAKPLLGYGVDQAAYVLDFVTGSNFLSIDSYYLSITLDSGLPALILLAFLLGYFFWLGAGLWLRYRSEESLIAGMLALSIVGFAVVKAILSVPYNFSLVFMVFAMLLVLREHCVAYADSCDVIGRRGKALLGNRRG